MARKWLNGFLLGLAVILFLIAAFVLLLHTSKGKSIVKKRIETYLNDKLQTLVRINSIDYRLPQWVELNGVLIMDKFNDTLLVGKSLLVNIDMLKLMSNDIQLTKINLDSVNLFVRRNELDSNFNYQFLIDAFTAPKDTNAVQKPMQLTLGTIALNNVGFNFQDAKLKMYYRARIGRLDADIEKVDLSNQNYQINTWTIGNSQITVVDSSSTKEITAFETPNNEPIPLMLQMNKLGLRNIQFEYKAISDKLSFSTTVDTFQIDNPAVDLAKQSVNADNLILNNSRVSFAQGKEPGGGSTTEIWKITAGNISLDNNSFTFDNNLRKPVNNGIDFNHLRITNIDLEAKGTIFEGTKLKSDIVSSSLDINDKARIREVKGSVNLTDSFVQITDARVAANSSRINTSGTIYFPIVKQNSNQSNANISLNISQSYVAYADVLLFAPQLRTQLPLALETNERVSITGNASGTIKQLNFRNLNLSTSSGRLALATSGNVRNLDNPQRIQYQLRIDNFFANKNILAPSVLQKLEKQNLQLPQTVSMRGSLGGTTNSISPDLLVNTSYGSAQVKGNLTNLNNPDNLQYNLQLNANSMETGKWIGNDSLLGKLDGNITIRGRGTNINTLVADAKVLINSFVFNGYSYSNVDLEGRLDNGNYSIEGDINDPNLVTAINLTGNFQGNYPSATGNINIVRADFGKLNLSPDSLIVSSNIIIDAANLDPKLLNASVFADSSTLVMNGRTYYLDSLLVKGNSDSDTTLISIQSPLLIANLQGKYNYVDLPVQLNSYIQRNYMQRADTVAFVAQQAKLDATLVQHDLIAQLIPNLSIKDNVIINGDFNNAIQDTALRVDLSSPAISFTSTKLEEVRLNIRGSDTALRFSIGAENLFTPQQQFYTPRVEGVFHQSMINADAKTFDAEGKEYYSAKADIKLEDNRTVINLKDSLILNYENWNIVPTNSVSIEKGGFVFTDFTISNNKQYLSINSQRPTPDAPLEIKVDSFQIANLLSIINRDTLLADGKLHARVTIQQPIINFPGIDGTATIDSLTIQRIPVGDLNLKSTYQNDIVTLDASVTGQNEMTFKGQIRPRAGTIDLTASLKELNANVIEALSAGQISRASGNLHGDIRLTGEVGAPEWNGSIKFDTVAFALTQFGSLYRIDPNQEILVQHPEIRLDQLKIRDTANNLLTINGAATTIPGNVFGLNFTVRTRNFIAINSPRRPESIVYGLGVIDANVRLGGTSNLPDLDGNVTLRNPSSVHYAVPQRTVYVDARKEIVEFINMDTVQSLAGTYLYRIEDSVRTVNRFRGLKYNLNLQVRDDAELSILIDPATNDELVIRGEGMMNVGLDENGELGITGVYRLDSGYYQMNYRLLKRRFELVEGSTLSFQGDPKDATADITAQYEVLASAEELLGDEVGETPENLGASFGQRIPFIVVLYIKGSITKPELSFDIKLKEGTAGVNSTMIAAIDNRLAQIRYNISDLNKQVFGLLILNRFIGASPGDFFAGNSAFNANDIAKESVGRFVGEAINQLAADLIQGADVRFNVKNYRATDNTINRTDVDINVSKAMLDNRLVVTLGKNFTLEGEDPLAKSQQATLGSQLPDISTAYKISRDGRYMIRVYRRNQYEAILDGYFIETGAAFLITVDYNHLQEIFRKSRRRRNQQERSTDQQRTITTQKDRTTGDNNE